MAVEVVFSRQHKQHCQTANRLSPVHCANIYYYDGRLAPAIRIHASSATVQSIDTFRQPHGRPP